MLFIEALDLGSIFTLTGMQRPSRVSTRKASTATGTSTHGEPA